MNNARQSSGFSNRIQPLSERQAQIIEMIRQRDFVGVAELATHFDVAEQTIRRDLNSLCERGMARRVRGGIQHLNMTGNTAYAWRQVLHHEEKEAIAREVARHVPNGISVAFSIGTTPEIICGALLDHDQLRIFTNNLNLALLASTNPTFEVTIAGGRLRNEDRDILGVGMVELFQAYKVDIGIYGVAGVDEDGTLLDFYEEEVRARQLVQQNSRAAFLVLDHSKFGRSAHVRGGHINQASMVFCDRIPPAGICEMIHNAGARLIVCGGETL